MYPAVQAKNVIVTGCSSGIGAVTARFLRARGWNVVPTARKPEDLERLRADGFSPVELEMVDSASVRRAFERTLDICGGRLGGLVNNAAAVRSGAVEHETRDGLRHVFEVNVLGLQELTNCCIPVFRRQGWGRVVNISSSAGIVCPPFFGAYAASKAALEMLSDGLRIELAGSGIAVCVVEPGPLVMNAEPRRFMWPGRSPHDVAARVAHALESTRPCGRYRVTVNAWGAEAARRFAPPWLVDRLMVRRRDCR